MYSGDWPISRKFRVQVTVSGESVTESFTPFAIEIDFAALLSAKRIAGKFARHSLIVTRIAGDRFEEPAAHAMSEDFTRGDKGGHKR